MANIYIFYAITIVNLISFFAYGIDKWLAVAGKWRIRELFLLGLGLVGGSVGCLIGMIVFRHKLSKNSFRAFIPVFTALHWLLIFYMLKL